MEKRRTTVITALLAAVLALAGASAEDRPLIETLTGGGYDVFWDSAMELGFVRLGEQSLRIIPGEPWLVGEGGKLIAIQPVSIRNGSLIASDVTIETIRKALLPARQAARPRVRAIVIDAGHGGRDPGAVATHTLEGKTFTVQEKDVVLTVAKAVVAQLAARYPGIQVLQTRPDDTYISLEDRTDKANAAITGLNPNEVVIFVSLHANMSINRNARGFEVWYLPPEYRRTLLSGEEAAAASGVTEILNAMLEEEYSVESILLARNIYQALDKAIGSQSPGRGLKSESWFVVRNARMPSVLVELGFLSHPAEGQQLTSELYLQNLSNAVYSGVADFIDWIETSKPGTDQ